MSDIGFPEDLGHRHFRRPAPIGRHAGPLSLLGLGSIAAALFGAFGGHGLERQVADGEGARLEIEAPAVLRNGEFHEGQATVPRKRPVADLVLAVEPGLRRPMTQASMLSAAPEESFEAGAFRLSYGPVPADEPTLVEMEFQIDPALLGDVAGPVSGLDGETDLSSLPIAVRP